MIDGIRKRVTNLGVYPLLIGGAAVVILLFIVMAYPGSERTTPNTGTDIAGLAPASASARATQGGSPIASAAASSTASATAHPSAAVIGVAPTSAAPPPAGAVLVDKNARAGLATWQSPAFTAPKTWSISYTYNCGGYGGHFDVGVFSDLTQNLPIQEHRDSGSGTVTIHGGGTGYYIATDTTKDCAWHVTARA